MTIATPMALSVCNSAMMAPESPSSRVSDLQLEPVRGEGRVLQRGGDDVADATGQTWQELRGRQVHRNGQVPGPSYRGAARRPQRPRTDPLDELQFLGHRNEYQWRNKYSVFRRQAYQCLEAGEAA